MNPWAILGWLVTALVAIVTLFALYTAGFVLWQNHLRRREPDRWDREAREALVAWKRARKWGRRKRLTNA